jgi:hypothetical protein
VTRALNANERPRGKRPLVPFQTMAASAKRRPKSQHVEAGPTTVSESTAKTQPPIRLLAAFKHRAVGTQTDRRKPACRTFDDPAQRGQNGGERRRSQRRSKWSGSELRRRRIKLGRHCLQSRTDVRAAARTGQGNCTKCARPEAPTAE